VPVLDDAASEVVLLVLVVTVVLGGIIVVLLDERVVVVLELWLPEAVVLACVEGVDNDLLGECVSEAVVVLAAVAAELAPVEEVVVKEKDDVLSPASPEVLLVEDEVEVW